MRALTVLLSLSLAGCGLLGTQSAPTGPPGPPPPLPPSAPSPSGRPAPPAVISPGASPEADRRLSTTAQSRIDGAEQLVRQIETKQLDSEQQQSVLTIQSFLTKAREAISVKDFQRAFTLADKAHQLAEDLVRRVR